MNLHQFRFVQEAVRRDLNLTETAKALFTSQPGISKAIRFELVDYFDGMHGISAMMRTTGYSLSITGQMQADGRVAAKGVHTPDEAIPFAAYVQELGRRGIRIEELQGPGGC